MENDKTPNYFVTKFNIIKIQQEKPKPQFLKFVYAFIDKQSKLEQ